MTREEYFMCLEGYLKELTYEECKEALQYYENYFDEAGPENEQEVIEQLGSPKQLAESILRSEGIGDGTNENKTYEKHKEANVIPYGDNKDNEQNDKGNNSYANYSSGASAFNGTNESSKKDDEDRIVRIIILIVVVIAGFPILASIFGVIVGIVAALFFGGFGLVLGGISGIIGSIATIIKLGFGMGMMFFGLSLILIAVGMFLFFLLYAICRYLVPVCIRNLKKLWNWILVKKEAI